ncbi:hypothetical protein Acr_23g0010970 [Actinidia rufa]|uniref:RNase H type-1 domain-containing protein n=1 Tax=Actinidia rufa TaxID=165716 RepID=A0A7J0GPJ4_9ERIC|nr:hypothetical protein Acr_23g0010970 [Actinidia rufa]
MPEGLVAALPWLFGAIYGNDSSQYSMHLHSCLLPRQSTSSPLDNRTRPMANTSQASDLDGIHHDMHGIVEQIRIMNEINACLDTTGNETRRCRKSPRRDDRAHRCRDNYTTQKIKDLDAWIDAINTGINALITVDVLIRKTEPLFTKRVMKVKVSSKFKLPSKLGTYDGKIDPMDHLDSYKNLMMLHGGYLRKFVVDCPRLDSPDRGYANNKPIAGDIQTIHEGFELGGCSALSPKRHARETNGQEEEEFYNLSTLMFEALQPITFTNEDLRGLHLPHDDALVISTTIANFNMQRILIDNGSFADILFISAFDKIRIRDSQLVVNQVQGDYLAKDLRMMAYLDKVNAISMKIKDFKTRQIPREENKKADALTNLASTFDFVLDRSVLLEFFPNPNIDIAKNIYQATTNPTWMDDIIAYLKDGELPSDKLQARGIQYRSARFCLLHGMLYKRSFSELLICLRPEELDYVLREIHEDIYENHLGARSLVRKTVRQGYFWLCMERDVLEFTRKYDNVRGSLRVVISPISRWF